MVNGAKQCLDLLQVAACPQKTRLCVNSKCYTRSSQGKQHQGPQDCGLTCVCATEEGKPSEELKNLNCYLRSWTWSQEASRNALNRSLSHTATGLRVLKTKTNVASYRWLNRTPTEFTAGQQIVLKLIKLAILNR